MSRGGLEGALVSAMQSGGILDLSRMPRRNVPADLIREIVQHSDELAPDGRGLQIEGAHFRELLDLEAVTSAVRVSFRDCIFHAGVRAWNAKLGRLNFQSCVAHGAGSDPAIECDEASIAEGMDLNGLRATAKSSAGAVRLVGVAIAGQLNCRGAVLRNESGPGLSADYLTVGSSAHFEGLDVEAHDGAAVRLQGAKVGANAHFADGRLVSTGDSPSLLAGFCEVANDLVFDGVPIQGSSPDAAISLDYAKAQRLIFLRGKYSNSAGPLISAVRAEVAVDLTISKVALEGHGGDGGALMSFDGALVRQDFVVADCAFGGSTGALLNARGMKTERDCLLTDLAVDSRSLEPTISLRGAAVTANLTLKQVTMINHEGPVVAAEGLTVRGRVGLVDAKLTAQNQCALELADSHLGSLVSRGKVELSSQADAALSAVNATCDGDLQLHHFHALGAGAPGTVRLTEISVGGNAELKHAKLSNESGPAFSADGARVSGRLAIEQSSIAGDGGLGAIRLIDVQVQSQVVVASTSIANGAGPACVAQGLHVGQDLQLATASFAGSGEHPTIDLGRGKIGLGLLVHDVDVSNAAEPKSLWGVDGLTFPIKPIGSIGDKWLNVLTKGTPLYAAQPYQQLAGTTRDAGHDSETRQVLIAQRRDQRARGDLSRLSRAWGWFLDLSIGYGYRPWRALIGLALIVTIAVIAALWTSLGTSGLESASTDSAATPRTTSANLSNPQNSRSCSPVDRALLAVDTAVPLVDSDATKRCVVNTRTRQGRVLMMADPLLQILGWAVTTLFVAGFTGVVRRP